MYITQSKALLFLAVITVTASAEINHVNQSMQSFTGLLNTPHAQTHEYGIIELGYSPYFDHSNSSNPTYSESTNLKAFIALVPNLETSVRLATKYWHRNCYTDGCDYRDLSFSAKYQLPFIPEEWLSISVGGQDLGGAAVNSRAYYGVASKQLGDFRFSAGIGQSESQMGWLSGPFAGVEWQPLDWLQLLAEYDANATNAGVKLITPQSWLPEGWQINMAVQSYSSEERNDKDVWIGGSLTFPLTLGSSPKRYQNNWPIIIENKQPSIANLPEPQQNLPAKDEIVIQGSLQMPAIASEQLAVVEKSTGDNRFDALQQTLVVHGFEDVTIAYEDSVLTIKAENQVFNWNTLDAIGVAMGEAAHYANSNDTVRLILTRFRLPVVQVDSQNRCLVPWLEGTNVSCESSELFKISTSHFDIPKQWDKQEVNRSQFIPRLIFAPLLYHTLGTEYGAFDYTVGLSSNLQMTVWQGGNIDIRHKLPLDNSDDFSEGNRFASMKIENEIDRILFHQTVRLPYGLFTKLSVGRVRGDYDGVLSETQWQSDYGRHKLGMEIGNFTRSAGDAAREPLLGRYRYFREDLDWAFEITAGQFWNNDQGVKLESHHWFGDSMFSLQLRKTEDKFAGVAITIPLTFRKDHSANHIQIRGIEQWSFGLETTLRENDNNLTFGQGVNPGFYHNIDQAYFNRDRLSPAYIQSNLDRVTDAYRTYVED